MCSVSFFTFQSLLMILYYCTYFALYFQCTLPVQKLDASDIWHSFYMESAYTCPFAKKAVFLWNPGKKKLCVPHRPVKEQEWFSIQAQPLSVYITFTSPNQKLCLSLFCIFVFKLSHLVIYASVSVTKGSFLVTEAQSGTQIQFLVRSCIFLSRFHN